MKKNQPVLRLPEPIHESGWQSKPNDDSFVAAMDRRPHHSKSNDHIPNGTAERETQQTLSHHELQGATVTIVTASKPKPAKPNVNLSSQFATQFMAQHLNALTGQDERAVKPDAHRHYQAVSIHNGTNSTFEQKA